MATGKRFKAAVVGGSGYGGAEMIRRLLVHPDVELVRVASIDFVGEPLAAADPALEQVTDLVFEGIPPGEAAQGVDVVLLGLPHTVAASKLAEIAAASPTVKVVDMSGDFRLKDVASYERWYKHTHPCPERLKDFVYGLPELNREAIRKARFVASPGCFATTIELALLPLARAGLLEGVVHVQGITGSSGSGVAPSAGTHHPVRAGNLRTYKPLEHQHVPEITETLALAGARDLQLRFVPVSAPLVRGILATAFVELPEEWTPARLEALYRETYAGEPFVRVPRKRLPEVAAVSGSNHAEVGVAAGAPRNGRRTVTLFGATDNLVKGGAGQAIENMNLMLGLDEKASLADPGPWPP
ncbi:N-acetyl-gamma-glutamyl-phosphate reductase [Anaeromyxobacter oryzae]|uniref:N-acetyl-gamma-glutamyl-phosphate reductase n=1 Tax=Anaeromyxobacter oryzae TaxID=2918170 RepID=A0ABM7WW47_9BACT|nr:N-acetyl-gamma-glutamyl-phosphate reductase [Anaeromyxobacter oryzae]BDG03717.1 N-acetyl-gamma-glutamyl-phosphate/N-acetyl-gamma- aminoadipyl-phosphate reductase [Anaeromyxobacter oryzae]